MGRQKITKEPIAGTAVISEYQKAIDYTFLDQDFTPEDTIVDLFCGTGTIGQLVANQAKGAVKVIGVDIIRKAIEDAKKNAKKNGLENLEFYAADVKNFLTEHPEFNGKIKTVNEAGKLIMERDEGMAEYSMKEIEFVN